MFFLASLRSYFDQTDFPSARCVQGRLIPHSHCFPRSHFKWVNLQQDYMYRAHNGIRKFSTLYSSNATTSGSYDKRHGNKQMLKRTLRLQQLERNLIKLFKLGTKVLASDRDIFNTPISDLLTLPPREISKWITSLKSIILQSHRDARHNTTPSNTLSPATLLLPQMTPPPLQTPPIGPCSDHTR
jgi:hypothetical protein